MKYLLISSKGADEYVEEYNTAKEAIDEIESYWHTLSEYDKKHLKYLYLLESVNPDEDATDHYDGDIIAELIDTSTLKPEDRIIISYKDIEKWLDESNGEEYEESYVNTYGVRYAVVCDKWVRIGKITD